LCVGVFGVCVGLCLLCCLCFCVCVCVWFCVCVCVCVCVCESIIPPLGEWSFHNTSVLTSGRHHSPDTDRDAYTL